MKQNIETKILNKNIVLTPKQQYAFNLIMDETKIDFFYPKSYWHIKKTGRKMLDVLNYGGALGGGKTFWDAIIIESLAQKFPGIHIAYCRDELTKAKQDFYRDTFSTIFPEKIGNRKIYKYNAQESTIEHENRSFVKFLAITSFNLSQYPKNEVIVADEATDMHFPSLSKFCVDRNRFHATLDKNISNPIIINTFNFRGIGYGGMKEECVRQWGVRYDLIKEQIREGIKNGTLSEEEIKKLNMKKDVHFWVSFAPCTPEEPTKSGYIEYDNGDPIPRIYCFIFANMNDNPYLSPEYKANMLNQYTKEQREIIVYGGWDIILGAFFDYDKSIHDITREQAKSMIKENWLFKDVWDYGNGGGTDSKKGGDPSSIGWFAESPDKIDTPLGRRKVIILYKQRQFRGFVETLANAYFSECEQSIFNDNIKHQPDYIIMPPDAHGRGGMVRNSEGTLLGEGDYRAFQTMCLTQMKWFDTIVTQPYTRDHEQGWQALKTLFNNNRITKLEHGLELPPLFYVVAEDCQTFTETIPSLVSDHLNSLELADRQNDHDADMARYFAVSINKYLEKSTKTPTQKVLENPNHYLWSIDRDGNYVKERKPQSEIDRDEQMNQAYQKENELNKQERKYSSIKNLRG